MFNSNIPFGYSNNCSPFGGSPFNCAPFDSFGGYNCSPVSGWNSSFYGGVNSPSLDCGLGSFGGYGLPSSIYSNSCSPFGFNHQPGYNWFGGHNWNSPVNGYNNWSHLGFGGQFSHPLSSNIPFSGVHQGAGYPGMISNSAWMGCNSPLMNWGACFPGSSVSPFVGASPISGFSNWSNSPWMGYAYPNYIPQHNVVNSGKNPINGPINGQYIPTGAFPFPCAPFNVPFPTNGYVPAGQGVNCEAA